jgi:quercetin dioxygenase-like cupin family protein
MTNLQGQINMEAPLDGLEDGDNMGGVDREKCMAVTTTKSDKNRNKQRRKRSKRMISFRTPDGKRQILRVGNVNIRVVVAFLFGVFLGNRFERMTNLLSGSSGIHDPSSRHHVKMKSSFQHKENISPLNTSHIDQNGNAITKQQFLDPFVVPNIAGISIATIQPGQTVAVHSHRTMHEFFFVLHGSATFYLDDVPQIVSPGSFVHVAPQSSHSIVVPKDTHDGDLQVILFGVVVE